MFIPLSSKSAAACLWALSVISSSAAVLWHQDFSSSGNIEDYIGPGPNLADGITTSGPGVNWMISNGALQATRIGNAGSFTISEQNFGTDVFLVQLRFQVSNITTSAAAAMMFAVGSSFSPTSNSHPINDVTHSDFSLNFNNGTPDTFRFRDHDNSTNLGNAAASTDAIEAGQWIDLWWGINNSGASLAYSRPDGSTATLANNRWDLWANIGGVWQQIGNNPTNTNNVGTVLDDLKITFVSGEGTVMFDEITISDELVAVPEVSTLMLSAGGAVLLRRRKR